MDNLEESIEELYLVMGKSIQSTSFGSKNPNDKEIIGIGKNWFELQRAKISEVICGNDKIKAVFEKNDRNVIIGTLLDIFSQYTFPGVVPLSAFVASIAHYGYKYYCK